MLSCNKESLKKEMRNTMSQVESLMMLDISNFKLLLQKNSKKSVITSPSPKLKRFTKTKVVKKNNKETTKKSTPKSIPKSIHDSNGKSKSVIMPSPTITRKVINPLKDTSSNNSPNISKIFSDINVSSGASISFSLSNKPNNYDKTDPKSKNNSSFLSENTNNSPSVTIPPTVISPRRHKKSKSTSRIFSMGFKIKGKNTFENSSIATSTRVSLSSDLFGFNPNSPPNPNKKHLKEIKNDENMKSSFEDFLNNKNSISFWDFWLEASDLVEIQFEKGDQKDDFLFIKSKNIYTKYLSSGQVKIIFFFIF